MASRSVFQLTNQTRLGVLEPWRAFCVALHVNFTESRCILLRKRIHKFYALQLRCDSKSVKSNVKLAVRKPRRTRPQASVLIFV